MKFKKKDRSGSAKTTPVIRKGISLPLDTKVLKERAPVKGKDVAALVLALIQSGEGNDEW
jgi:hypothetical protein